jgi:poly(3-hydroxybutyrate) depolymerase
LGIGGNTISTGGNPAGTGGKSVGVGGNSIAAGGNSVGIGGNSVGVGGSSVDAGGTSVGAGGSSVGAGGSSVGAGGSSVGAGGSSVGAGGTSVGVGGTSVGAGGSSVGVGGSSVGVGGSSVGAGGSSGIGTNSPGCGKTITRPSATVQQTMTVGGTTRYYLLDVPANADNTKPLMLIFALHGYNMNNVSITGLFNFTSRSNGKAITVYPQGEGDPPGNVSHWGSGISSTYMPNDANYAFIHDLMTDLENRYCIDTSRVFLAGFSMGGLFTNFTACDHSDWFRAYAPVEGMGPGGSQDGTTPLSCANANAKPAIMIHQGTADTSVPPEQGKKTRDFWVTQNGCTKTTTTSFTGCQSYSACAQPVIYCEGSWSHTIDPQAASNIWSFFSGF